MKDELSQFTAVWDNLSRAEFSSSVFVLVLVLVFVLVLVLVSLNPVRSPTPGLGTRTGVHLAVTSSWFFVLCSTNWVSARCISSRRCSSSRRSRSFHSCLESAPTRRKYRMKVMESTVSGSASAGVLHWDTMYGMKACCSAGDR